MKGDAPRLTIHLMRHGRTEEETPWRYLGQRDVPLSEAGRAQARRWAEVLADVDFAGAWCSDLSRCRETAGLVLADRNLEATPQAGLREMALGEWDGLSLEEVKRLYPGQYEARGADLAGFRPPGGESFADLAQRAWTGLEHIQEAAGRLGEANILVVAHAGVNRVLLCKLLGIPLGNLFSLAQDPGCLNILRLGGENPLLQALNLTLERFSGR